MSEQVLGKYVHRMVQRVQELKSDLANLNAQSLYEVGKLQGRIAESQEAIHLLEDILKDTEEN